MKVWLLSTFILISHLVLLNKKVKNMKIIGTGSVHPKKVVTNDMIAEFLDTSDEWITTRTGIKERRVITDEEMVDMAAEASQKALDAAGVKSEDLDYIICSKTVNEYDTPGVSCIVEGKIGAYCPTLDINGACAGFEYALDIANSFFLSKPKMNYVLIVCAEEITRMVSWKERENCVLFGDASGAVVLTRSEVNHFKSFALTNKSATPALFQKRVLQPTPFITKKEEGGPLFMNGREVFKMAVTTSVRDIKQVVEEAGYKPDEIKYYLLHQANIRIIDYIRKKLGQTTEQFPHNIEKYGNTSSASIPCLLDELIRDGKIEKGDKLVFSAFGAGFITGACMLEW